MTEDITRRDLDVAWAAGLFEGEGCFNAYLRPATASSDSRKNQTQARLRMTDKDAVERFAAIVGVGTFRGPIVDERAQNKDSWEWYVQNAPGVRYVIALLLPWLCERRAAKALEVDAAAATIGPAHARRTECPKGHPLSGDNLLTETIPRAGKTYQARRCRTCRRKQSWDRARRVKNIAPETFRVSA